MQLSAEWKKIAWFCGSDIWVLWFCSQSWQLCGKMDRMIARWFLVRLRDILAESCSNIKSYPFAEKNIWASNALSCVFFSQFMFSYFAILLVLPTGKLVLHRLTIWQFAFTTNWNDLCHVCGWRGYSVPEVSDNWFIIWTIAYLQVLTM